MSDVRLPEQARAGLADLFARQEQAKLLYSTALNSALAVVGLDPRLQHHYNVDTGVITPAGSTEAAAGVAVPPPAGLSGEGT